jgi:hypothetical protein
MRFPPLVPVEGLFLVAVAIARGAEASPITVTVHSIDSL